MIELNGAIEGKYPAGIQGTVLSDNPECIGWIVDGKTYELGEVVTFNKSVTVEEKLKQYTVTYVSDAKEYATQTGPKGAALSYPAPPARDGYTFSGWNTDAKVIGTCDLTVVALWTKVIAIDGMYIDDFGNVNVVDRGTTDLTFNKADLVTMADKIGPKCDVVVMTGYADVRFPVSTVGKLTGAGSGDKLGVNAYPVANITDLKGFGNLSPEDAQKISKGLGLRIGLEGAATTSNLGVVTVTNIGYTPGIGDNLNKIRVCCVNEDGTVEYLNSGFDFKTKAVWFETTHFSEFVVFNDSDYRYDTGNDYVTVMIVICAATIAVIGISVALRPRKN